MSRYDGLIIPRSYNEYINKTDPVAMSQALQLNNVLAQEVAAGNNKAVTSNAVNGALTDLKILNFDTTKTDANDCIQNKNGVSFYHLGATRENIPDNLSPWFIETYEYYSNISYSFIHQIAKSRVGGDFKKNAREYFREGVKNNNVWSWSNWQKLTTESDLENYQTKLNKIGFIDFTAGQKKYYKIATITALNTLQIGSVLIRGSFHTSAGTLELMCNTFEIAFSCRSNVFGFSGWFYNTPLANDDIIAIQNTDETVDIYIMATAYTRILIECDDIQNINLIFNKNIVGIPSVTGTQIASAKGSNKVKFIYS